MNTANTLAAINARFIYASELGQDRPGANVSRTSQFRLSLAIWQPFIFSLYRRHVVA
jgi:hypothetical protein